MDRIRQHLTRRRRSSGSSSTPLQSRSLSASGERRKKDRDSIPRRLILTSDTPDFDQRIIRRFEAEGLKVRYLPFLGGGQDLERDRKDLENRLNELEDDLEPGERYAVVAYKHPAYLLLLSHHQSTTTTNPLPRLCALIAYYPTPPFDPSNPGRTNPTQCIPPAYPNDTILPLQIHLAAHQSPSLYDNYGLNPDKKRHRCHAFFYPESQAGFAEYAAPSYDPVDAELAWSRVLDCVKSGFQPGASWTVPDIETVWVEYWQSLSTTDHHDNDQRVKDTLALMVDPDPDNGYNGHDNGPSVTCIPTKTTASGTSSLTTFYQTTYFPTGPPSQHLRLLTRTTGSDRIVDEVLFSFTHTEEIPWLLPGVQPSNRDVHIRLVLAGDFCAGKLATQNVYWDQASVLVQVGLLDPNLLPGSRSDQVLDY